MSADVVIEVENLSKRYRIGAKEKGYKNFRETIIDSFTAPVRNLRRLRRLTRFDDSPSKEQRASSKEFNATPPSPCPVRSSQSDDTIWALRDVSFEVRQGEVVGIIGRNGAGKTTLLKILSRVTEPTSGEAKIYGRVSSLLEVGTGFHPELTGRENIYLNGTILGMRKQEIKRKFDDIVAFAEIQKFIDTPVKHFSSGMYVRLAFAVAAHLEPEILLVDEVLSVGDAGFQQKCLGKIGDIREAGRTVLLVSHNMTSIVKLCETAIWIDKGSVRSIDVSEKTVHAYLSSGLSATNGQVFFEEPDREREAYVCSLELKNGIEEVASDFDVLSPIKISISFRCRKHISTLRLDAVVSRYDGIIVFSTTSQDYDSIKARFDPGFYQAQLIIPGQFLASGEYYLSIGIVEPNIKVHDLHESVLRFRVVGNPFRLARTKGLLVYPFEWKLAN